MNGLNEIIFINAHAAASAVDKARQARGLKPVSKVGQVLRKVAAERPVKFRKG